MHRRRFWQTARERCVWHPLKGTIIAVCGGWTVCKPQKSSRNIICFHSQSVGDILTVIIAVHAKSRWPRGRQETPMAAECASCIIFSSKMRRRWQEAAESCQTPVWSKQVAAILLRDSSPASLYGGQLDRYYRAGVGHGWGFHVCYCRWSFHQNPTTQLTKLLNKITESSWK